MAHILRVLQCAIVMGSLAVGLGGAPAQAQFLCTDVGTGTAQGATATGSSLNFACGPSANASGATAANTASGNSANASGDLSANTAIGNNANASGSDPTGDTRNTAIGNNANASGNNSRNTASGEFSNASGNNSNNVATGTTANASGNSSGNVANGANSNASGTGSFNVAVGQEANASGNGNSNTAVGAFAHATGFNSSAFGSGASASFSNSAAFGSGATATRADQQVFGTASNTYTMTGIASGASQAAQSGPLSIVTSDNGGDLAARSLASLGIASSTDITNLQTQINQLGQRDKELAGGIAISMALAQPILLNGQNFAVRAGWGNFDGSNAVGVSGAGVLNRGWAGRTSSVVLDGGVGVGTEVNTVAGRAGVTFGW